MNPAPRPLRALLAGAPGAPPEYRDCDPDDEVAGLSLDSRAAARGAAFLAVPGATHDGHAFATAALAAGASVVVVERGRLPDPPRPCVLLDDTAAAWPILAANAWDWPARSLALCGVTGTNGKTTVAHLVGQILEATGHAHVRLGTTGNRVGGRELPAALTTPPAHELQALLAEGVAAGARHGVMEVSSHALDQRRVEPLRFAVVALTSFSQDHLDYHGDMESYLRAKLRLAGEYLGEGGLAVAFGDRDPAGARFLAGARAAGRRTLSIATDPRSAAADLRVTSASLGAAGIGAELATPAGPLALASVLAGAHNLDNLLVALACAHGLGVPWAAGAAALATARGAPGRLERIEAPGGGGPRVFVDYAHTPDAVERVLQALRPLTGGRLVVVLGCGGDRDPGKRPRMGALAARDADRFFATSDNPRSEDPDAIVDQMLAEIPADRRAGVVREVDRACAIDRAVGEAGPDDVVLIAGKGHEDYQILGATRIHFDDREHARAALTRRFG